MQPAYDYYESECPWYYFESSYKTLLGSCITVFGLSGVLLNGWLFITFLYSHLITARSHILVLNLCTSTLARNLLEFPFASSSAFAKEWLFGNMCCQYYAFINQFLGVFQTFALLVLALERYYQAKRYKDGKDEEMRLIVYWLLVGLCWVSAALFAAPPLFGLGTYTCDITSTSCTFLWPSPTSGAEQLAFSTLLVVFGGIVPDTAIIYFIVKTIPKERWYKSEFLKERRRLTQSIHTACLVTLALWVPAAVLVGWQWLPLLLYGYRMHVPPALVLLAPIATEAASSVPVLCYLACDERLRAALLGRVRSQYALLRPHRAKKYVKAVTAVYEELRSS